MLKEKKCHGLGRAKGHGCEKLVPVVMHGKANRVFGLGKNCGCYSEWLMNTDEGNIVLEKATLSGKRTVRIETNKKKKAEKKKHRDEKSLNNDWSKKLQTEINTIARTIDKGLTCLARNVGGKMDAGHVYARGGNQTIRYNLHNIHRQSAHSNHWQNDDGVLREGLVNEYGQEYMDFISDLRKTPSLEFNNFEYRELTVRARKIVKQLKKDDRIYSKSERIEMRNRINYSLRIYDSIYCQFEN